MPGNSTSSAYGVSLLLALPQSTDHARIPHAELSTHTTLISCIHRAWVSGIAPWVNDLYRAILWNHTIHSGIATTGPITSSLSRHLPTEVALASHRFIISCSAASELHFTPNRVNSVESNAVSIRFYPTPICYESSYRK